MGCRETRKKDHINPGPAYLLDDAMRRRRRWWG